MCCTGLQISQVFSVPLLLHRGGGERDRMTMATTKKTTRNNVLNNCVCTLIGYKETIQQVTISFLI